LGGDVPQATHADLDFDDHLDFCFVITVNFYLIDVGPENGATEWWVGTHHFGVKDVREKTGPVEPYIRKDALEARGKICPPVRPFVPKGSVVIRDLRIWHGAYPNPTGIPRIMLGWVRS
jgi:ectoine hydroxylase-related dioxygenase (phytanoyl-CoA dioxygenase family)